MKTYLFRVVVEPDDDRWVAYCPALEEKGGATWGRTYEEALENIQVAVRLTIESMRAHGESIPDGPEQDVRVMSEPAVAVTV